MRSGRSRGCYSSRKAERSEAGAWRVGERERQVGEGIGMDRHGMGLFGEEERNGDFDRNVGALTRPHVRLTLY